MKRIVFISIIILLFCISPSYGHSGRTDSKGGHRVTATGGYHYHHGFPPHDHVNGACPYLIKDNNNDTKIENNENKSSVNSASYLMPTIAICGGGILLISAHKNKKEKKKEKELREKKSQEEKEQREKKYQEEKEYYSKLYLGKDAKNLAGVPNNVNFDANKLPIILDHSEHKWGKMYTVYITNNGKSFHQTKGCSNSNRPVHIFQASRNKVPCKRCVKNHVVTPAWYSEYLRICNIKDKYKIE